MSAKKHHVDTKLGHLGLSPEMNFGIPNPPIYRTSTILSSSMAQHRGDLPKAYTYGRSGTPTSASFERAQSPQFITQKLVFRHVLGCQPSQLQYCLLFALANMPCFQIHSTDHRAVS